MKKTRKPHKMRQAARRYSLAPGIVFGLCSLSSLVGCNSPAHTHSGDPLYGEYYPKGPNGQPMPPPNTPAKTSALAVPPYPLNNSASSTAALAGNGSLPGGRPSLAINENNGFNGTLTNTSKTGVANVPANGTPIVLPVPRDTAVAGPVAFGSQGTNSNPVPALNLGAPANLNNTVIAAGSWSTGVTSLPNTAPVAPLGVTTPQVLEGTLRGKGAVNIKQENVPEGVRVSCYVLQPSNPTNPRYLETVARDYPSALAALGQQIDQ